MPSGSDKGTKKTSGHHPAWISCHVLVASPSNKPDKGTPRRESRWPRRASLLPTAAAVTTTTTIVSDISDTSAGSGPLGPLINFYQLILFSRASPMGYGDKDNIGSGVEDALGNAGAVVGDVAKG